MGAVEKGWGGCIIKAFRNEDLRRLFHLPEELKINYVIALGKPKEKVVLEQMKGEDYRYWMLKVAITYLNGKPVV